MRWVSYPCLVLALGCLPAGCDDASQPDAAGLGKDAPSGGGSGAGDAGVQVLCPDTYRIRIGVTDSCGCTPHVEEPVASPEDPCRFSLTETLDPVLDSVLIDCEQVPRFAEPDPDGWYFAAPEQPVEIVLGTTVCAEYLQLPEPELIIAHECYAVMCVPDEPARGSAGSG